MFTKSGRKTLEKMIFVKEIITSATEPKLCPTCKKEDRIQKDIIREERTDGRTLLCTRCEALVVITTHNLKTVELSSRTNDTIMLKEPHLIRKIAY